MVKKPAAVAATSTKPKKVKTQPSVLFPSRPKNFRIGGDLQPKRDLSRYVRWPRYIRLQRQRKILLQRLKVPPGINQFAHVLTKDQASELFKLLAAYRPETRSQKKERLEKTAKAAVENPEAKTESAKPPPVIKFGLKHITTLVEEKKAKLVIIASNVDPIELVVWLPALCRKMGVPYCIVHEKARLGALVHQKKASCLALTAVKTEDQTKLQKLIDLCKLEFNDNMAVMKKWGGGVMGLRTQAKVEKHEKTLEAERQRKAQLMM